MQVLRSVTGSDMVQITSIPSASSVMAVIVLLCSLPILLNKYLTLILKKMASRKNKGNLSVITFLYEMYYSVDTEDMMHVYMHI